LVRFHSFFLLKTPGLFKAKPLRMKKEEEEKRRGLNREGHEEHEGMFFGSAGESRGWKRKRMVNG